MRNHWGTAHKAMTTFGEEGYEIFSNLLGCFHRDPVGEFLKGMRSEVHKTLNFAFKDELHDFQSLSRRNVWITKRLNAP
ncbi:MAG TPA: hypothetical protein DIT94_16710 [Deltaproteobacteria bacterium]|nr:hypothetical protein [Deltaproteobacteria bacterium]